MTRRPAARPPVLTGCCAVAEVKVAGDAIAEIEVGGRGRAAGEVEVDGRGLVVDGNQRRTLLPKKKGTLCFPVAGK